MARRPNAYFAPLPPDTWFTPHEIRQLSSQLASERAKAEERNKARYPGQKVVT